MLRRAALAVALAVLAAGPAAAQAEVQTIPFEGGAFTITETAEGEKIVAFDGKELARDYMAFHDRIGEVGNAKVALFSVGSGGNACGPKTLIAWKLEQQPLQSLVVGDDCGSPPPAMSQSAIYFVPSPLPGETDELEMWTPDAGLKVVGRMSFAPQPGSGWEQIAAKTPDYMYETFSNAAVFDAAQKLLGADLTNLATSLLTSSGAQALADGTIYGEGCAPHACGVRDGFMAIDAAQQKLYFAQQQEGAEPRTWPDIGDWPVELREAMHGALVGN